MAKSIPTAKFFCEFCETEVPGNAVVCPKCGHFFSSVRCPRCGHTGLHKEFIHGCKACGYAFKASNEKPKLPPKASRKTRKQALKAIFEKEKKTSLQKKEDALPYWIYIVSICALIVLLIIIVNKL